MDSEKEKNAQVKAESPPIPVIKSKSAERLIDEIKPHKNKHQKIERSYRVGNYLIKNTLGSGTFGKVKLGIYIPTQEKVAVKILEKSKMTEKDDQIRLEREFEMLAQFNHPNLIMVTEIFESDNNYYTVMDYCEGGELFNYIVKKKYLSEKEASFFYYQIISGLEYIHSLGIVHRDLKPENLLLTKDHILKIIDFGLSNYFKEGQNDLLYTPCGSPCYASPEMVTGNNYDGVMIDIWSTGIILFAMLCGYLPFEDKNNEKLFKKIAECKIDYPEFLSENALDLLKKIIVPNPKKRITINEIKRHPFYIKGKNLFDQEFTIQYLSDEAANSERNENSNKDNKNMQNNNKENCIENNNNNEDKKIIDKKEENIDKKDGNKPLKNELNNENKENCSNNYSINIDNIIKNSLSDNKNGDNSTNYIKIKDKNKMSNKSLKNDLSNNIMNNYDINNNRYQNKDAIKEKDNQDKKNNNKTINNNLNIFINKTQKELNDEKEKANNVMKKKTNNNNKELHKAHNNANITVSFINNNEKNIINSFNLKALDDLKNNIAITEIATTINNTEANINLENIDINDKKNNKLKDKNYLRIDELNNLHNSVDNKKVRNNNVNVHSNNNFNKSKEIKKKVNEVNNNNYCSNTYNIKKNKNILKGNKVLSTVLGKILKINISEKSKIKENIKNKEIKFKKINPNKNNEDELNKKIFNKRNTYCEGDSKVLDKQKLKDKAKEKKTEVNNSKKNNIFNPKTKYFILNSLSTDIKNNNTQFDIDKKNIAQNIGNFYIHENNGGNNSVRQDFYPTAMKKIGGVKKNYIENLKITSNSINNNKNLSINNKSNNDFLDYNIKTETNEVLHTDIGVNNMDPNSKQKFKMNKNLFKIESKLSSKESINKQKNSLYKKQNKGIYSSNNLKYFKVSNNGIIFKNAYKNILNEDRFTSNRKRNFKRKFNNLSNSNNIHHSENKIKKFTKIFIQKNVDNITSLANITSSYSSKINNNFYFKSDFVNYININNNKEKKNISSQNKSLKNEKILNCTNKYPIYYIEDGLSTIDYETKNKNINIVHSIKNKNNPAFSKYVRQIKKNNNYIHIRKKQIKPGNINRNKNRSITKTKAKQKSINTEENINLKETINNSNINSIKNPFNKINNSSIINKKAQVSRHKINLKKNNIYELSNNSNTNPLLNISNTFISFNMYPKYYLDPKNQLSSPKIISESPQHLKFSKKNYSNIKIHTNKKLASLVSNNHIRKNTSPGLESPLKKYEINNFKKIQQNIFNNIDNQKLFYYTNTEYDQNLSFPKNINLDTIRNSKSKLSNKKYKAICREITSNNKINKWKTNINQNRNFDINKNLSNTISPTNDKKYNNNIFNKHNLESNTINAFNKNNINNNIKNNDKKNNNCLSNFVINYDNNNSNKKKKELEIISPTHAFHFLKKKDMFNAFEKFNYNTVTNKDLSSKYGMTLKLNKNK